MNRLQVIVVSAAVALAAPVHAEDQSLGHLWLDFGLGYGNFHASSSPVPTGSGGLWLDAQIGGRISKQWLIGIDIGGLGMQASGHNYDPNYSDSSIYAQGLTNVFAVVQFEPQSDHGWFIGAGAGEVYYDNKSLNEYLGYQHSFTGPGGIARVGYDWPFANHAHFETVFSYELGQADFGEPIGGNLKFSIAALSFHVAYH